MLGTNFRSTQALVASVMPLFIGIPLFYCIAHYAIIATFHLMGYLIYQYHDVLGYEPEEQVVLKPLLYRPSPVNWRSLRLSGID